MVPGDDAGVAQLTVHAEGTHLALQGVPQLLTRLQVPDEVGAGVVVLKPGAGQGSTEGNRANARKWVSVTKGEPEIDSLIKEGFKNRKTFGKSTCSRRAPSWIRS